MFKGGAGHVGQSPFIGTSKATLKWVIPFKNVWGYPQSPVIGHDGIIYATSFDENKQSASLHGISQNGTILSTFRFNQATPDGASPALSPDGVTIYQYATEMVGDKGIGFLYALSVATFSMKWKCDTGQSQGNVAPITIGSDGTIYIGDKVGFKAVGADGKLKWSHPASFATSPSVSPDGKHIYVLSEDEGGVLTAFDNTGEKIWVFKDAAFTEGTSPIVSSDGTIYIVGKRKSDDKWPIYAISPNPKKIGRNDFEFQYKIFLIKGALNTSNPSLSTDRRLFIDTYARKVVAVDKDGKEQWTFDVKGNYFSSSPIIDAHGKVYFGDGAGHIYCVDAQGREVWSFKTGKGVFGSSPVIGSDGTVYFIGGDNKLYAIGE